MIRKKTLIKECENMQNKLDNWRNKIFRISTELDVLADENFTGISTHDVLHEKAKKLRKIVGYSY